MEKVSAANQAGKDVLEVNRKLVEQLDVKMKDFVSYQKMTYETMEEVRRLFADISVQKEDNNIYLSGGKSAQSAHRKNLWRKYANFWRNRASVRKHFWRR